MDMGMTVEYNIDTNDVLDIPKYLINNNKAGNNIK